MLMKDSYDQRSRHVVVWGASHMLHFEQKVFQGVKCHFEMSNINLEWL